MIASLLIAVIIVFSCFIIYYRDIIFTNEIEIEYGDGCIEKYINGELVTPLCINARQQAEVYWRQDEKQLNTKWPNLTLTNFSIN